MKLPQISHIHKNYNFLNIGPNWNFFDQPLPHKFHCSDMWGMYFFIFASCEPLTLTHKNLTKSYRDCLQNKPHVVLRSGPSLFICMERLTWQNKDHGVQLYFCLPLDRSGVWAPAPIGALFSTLPSFLLHHPRHPWKCQG